MIQTVPTIDPHQDTWLLVRAHPIFHGIDNEEVQKALPFFRLVTLQAGEVLIKEGAKGSMDLYLVLKGVLEVVRKADEETTGGLLDQFIVAQVKAGGAIGELSFIKGAARSASIQSLTKSILLSLEPDELNKLEGAFPRTACHLMKNMVGYVGDRLKQSSTNEVKALKVELRNTLLNARANLFFSYLIGLLCVYNLAIHTITNLSMDSSRASIVSATIILVFCGVLVIMIKHSKIPIQTFGLTTRNWKPAVKESMLWTVGIVGGLVMVKWILIQDVPRYHHLPLFDFDLGARKYLAFNFILYGMHSPIQEFIARGVLQGSLQHFFTGRNITFRAIIISNALFSATHVHLLNGLLGVIVFVPGLLWGWLYARHETLIGVSLSHILIGWSALFFLNIESLF